MIWWIVKLREPKLGLLDGNVQVMLKEDNKTPLTYLSAESAYVWAESVGLYIDNINIFVINRETKEFA